VQAQEAKEAEFMGSITAGNYAGAKRRPPAETIGKRDGAVKARGRISLGVIFFWEMGFAPEE
jgi:hypothetical protein